VGFFDSLTGGSRKLKQPAPDRLFAMTTAQVALDTELGLKHRGVAGIVFQPIATADFQSLLKDAEELLEGAAADTGTKVESADDEFGYRWVILRDSEFEDLVVSLNTVSTELQGGGYGDRLLACVFPFEDESGKPVYFIYNFKRGAFYPFVPAPGEKQRDTERELRLQAQLQHELPFEKELDRWFPLWEIPL
jgi:PspA associated protein B